MDIAQIMPACQRMSSLGDSALRHASPYLAGPLLEPFLRPQLLDAGAWLSLDKKSRDAFQILRGHLLGQPDICTCRHVLERGKHLLAHPGPIRSRPLTERRTLKATLKNEPIAFSDAAIAEVRPELKPTLAQRSPHFFSHCETLLRIGLTEVLAGRHKRSVPSIA